MAITGIFFDTDTGHTITNSYVVVGQLRADLVNARFDVSIYHDQAAFESGLQPITSEGYAVLTSSITNGIDSLYLHLLSLPEYAGFTTV